MIWVLCFLLGAWAVPAPAQRIASPIEVVGELRPVSLVAPSLPNLPGPTLGSVLPGSLRASLPIAAAAPKPTVKLQAALSAASEAIAPDLEKAKDQKASGESAATAASAAFDLGLKANEAMVADNRLSLLSKGEDVFREMISAVDSAKTSVYLETYIFSGDATGRRFAAHLKAKARQGVKVRLIYDSYGSAGLDARLSREMREAGVEILEYHPLAPWRSGWAWNRRDHRKILVVDGKTGFVGGVNIVSWHLPASRGGRDWRDTHVRVEGPAAADLEREFRKVWFAKTRQWFPLSAALDPERGESPVRVAANQEFRARLRIRKDFLEAVQGARSEILVTNPYFVPDGRILRALAEAARRGVRVALLLPGHSNHPSAFHAGRSDYDFLLQNGVQIFEWQGPMIHAKTAVIDGEWSSIGSYNLDHRSLRHNLELNLNVRDAGFGGIVRRQFLEDLQHSRLVTLGAWRNRPHWLRLLEFFFSRFKYLL